MRIIRLKAFAAVACIAASSTIVTANEVSAVLNGRNSTAETTDRNAQIGSDSGGPNLGSASRGVPETALRAAVTSSVRAVSAHLLDAMRARKIEDVLAYYASNTAYASDGSIGDWDEIVASAPARYATYTRLECSWKEPFRVDVLTHDLAVVTAVVSCQKENASGRSWRDAVARTEVLSRGDGRWRIIAVHESSLPGQKDIEFTSK